VELESVPARIVVMEKVLALLVAACLVVVAAASPAHGSTGPRWSVAQLAGYADAIVGARVESVTSAWDPAVNALYTYVALDVVDVFKGRVVTGPLAIKQLGGVVGTVGLFVADQATFARGEELLLFLEARPRDGTFYTSAMAQGKWTLSTSSEGQRIAVHGRQTIGLQTLRDVLAGAAADDREVAVETQAIDAPFAQPFALMPIPYRYNFFPPVDMQVGGQPGLDGGGVAEVRSASELWSQVGSSFRFLAGSSSRPRCSVEFLGSYRVTISFLDPCGEVSNSGGTIAIGGSYYTTASTTTVNGRTFRLALEGFIVNNDSRAARDFLEIGGCFHDVQLHELGHVLGLGHSIDRESVMFPTVSSGCITARRGPSASDAQGVQFIYPDVNGTPGQSFVAAASAAGELLTLEWFSGPGAAPSAHRLDFFADGRQVASVMVGPDTRVGLPLAADTRGAFMVIVTPFRGVSAGPPSPPFPFAIGLGCGGAPARPLVTGSIQGGNAAVTWNAVPGASSYLLFAGTTPGAADIVAPVNMGGATSASAGGLPAGFFAWVSVAALNACGQSAPGELFLR
jgi:hypothetical protein